MKLSDLFQKLISQLEQAKVFFGHGVAMAEDEVVLLLMYVTGLNFEGLNQSGDMSVNTNQLEKTQKLLQQRISENMPMAYVLGFSVFAGLKFTVDQRVLIPRSPIAELIDSGFDPWLDMEKIDSLLDLCTGSGCIGLALAHYYQHVQVDLSDLDTKALELASLNRDEMNLSGRVKCIESDLFDAISKQYDLIVTNPPYVSQDEYDTLPKEFSHEPASALLSHLGGLEIPVKILCSAADYLTDNGLLFLEVGHSDQLLSSSFTEIPVAWVEFEQGGQGVCVFSKQDLLKYRFYFKQFLNNHVA
ncbi:MAG: 50S ribosomal protein L3 N(5)-glutamine methyltransferase [Proteobacteria bacterium]|nr:50S ribosomal protein L3 N(5)-glutamine methyltransferase [Pseudomonadota bacterium]